MECLLDADYVTKDGKAVIRLFYKNESGREIKEAVGFEPYFYATARTDLDALADSVRKLNGVVKADEIAMLKHGVDTKVLRIVTTMPGEVPRLREEVRAVGECEAVYEADIPFARRYMIDNGLTPMENADKIKLNVAAIDIEVYNARGEPNAHRDPIIMMSYADNLGRRAVYTYKKLEGVKADYIEYCKSESDMLERFVAIFDSSEIDIITGYNSDNFDFQYIKERADKNKVLLNMGLGDRELKIERRGMNMGARITGRPHVDIYPVCRRTFNLPRYQLEDVYQSMFGEDKLEVKASVKAADMHKLWDSPKAEDFETLAKYSMNDADMTLKIAMEMLPLEYELARVVKQPLYETSRMSSSQRVENLLMRKAFEKKMLVPNRPSDEEFDNREDEAYEGAFVVEPVKGIHDNIVLFDFRSLYPSIIISHNIDPVTLDCKCCKEAGHKSPTGHRFCTNKKGFIPEVLEELLDRRMETNKAMKNETDNTKKRILDVQQKALKLLANSMYGYYGFQRARWYCRPCAEAITAWGRDYIHLAMKEAEKHGFTVIYGDTDSIYITRPDMQDVKKIVEKANEFQLDINGKLPEAMDLKYEGFYVRGVFITKKRYALMGEDGKLTVKGLETRRRDWCNIAKDTQKKVLDALLKDKDAEKAAEIVKEVVKEVKEGKVPLTDLAINTQMTRSLGSYVNEGPHVLAVRKAMKEGMDFKQGDIITYIQTKSGSSISDRARVIDFVEEGDYDADYYINNQIIPAVFRILEALGYSEDQLKGLGKQMTLGDW
ncbi:MAG: DNA-directed DNA polymerase [Candidatus Altiarchaeota archaeon]|nr:DNA-directed DNA polymerase [Candidatus Altiarchaeota archaeon]